MKTVQRRVLCPVCCREIPVRKDGLVQKHLAMYGHREACEGSGRYSARVTLASVHEAPPERPAWDRMSAAARFNALDEWDKADTLYDEFETMRQLGAASPAAVAEARRAVVRAQDTAESLAPIILMYGYPDEGLTA